MKNTKLIESLIDVTVEHSRNLSLAHQKLFLAAFVKAILATEENGTPIYITKLAGVKLPELTPEQINQFAKPVTDCRKSHLTINTPNFKASFDFSNLSTEQQEMIAKLVNDIAKKDSE